MPIILDDIDLTSNVAATSSVTPKFFSSRLTGSGKKTGVLNQFLLPVNRVNNPTYAASNDIERKQSSTNNDVTTTSVPMGLIMRSAMKGPDLTIPVPHADDRFTVKLAAGSTFAYNIFLDLTPQALTMYEDKSGDAIKRDIVIQYRMDLILIKDQIVEPERVHVASSMPVGHQINSRDAVATSVWDTSPMDSAKQFVLDSLAHLNILPPVNLDDELQAWLTDEYSVYERVLRLAQQWSGSEIADEISYLVDSLGSQPSDTLLNDLARQLRYLENYNVPLEAYRQIHAKIAGSFTPEISAVLSKQNLSLLMNYTLDSLSQIKPTLITPAAPTGSYAMPSFLSKEQQVAVQTHEPLVMTQAGAGTGKSTVILERIKYLESCGVSPKDVTVLSFTNAAADNITEKNPAVGSMTIARMIIDIYEANYPGHRISAVDTIINSLDIFYAQDPVAARFRQLLVEVDKNTTGAFTSLNTFIENRFDEVVAMLDQIGQTSLELQIILCYQKIDTMLEPAHVQSKYLIIDEVQDNSVFEFIYLLKYVTKHAQSLFIVGDASQTLYEFRSANPRALNTLEGSGVFTTMKLTTNYRSNQAILDMANSMLAGLETNQFANIQLQSNDLTTISADEFKDLVTIDHNHLHKLTGFTDREIPQILQARVIPDWVKPALDRGEQVAFLAYSRRDVETMRLALESQLPDKHLVNLVSDRVFSTDIFSKYIKMFWNDVLQVPPNNAAFVVAKGIQDNMDKLTKNAGSDKVRRAIMGVIQDWWVTNQSTITAWAQAWLAKSMASSVFFDNLRDNLLQYEIRRNQEKLNVSRQRNQERKEKNLQSNADLIVSTIHGAKGLEFDHVLVLYKDDAAMSEEVRRMYYVAFTRAKKSQYILSYGTRKNPPITTAFDQIVDTLTERDKASALRAQGIDPDAPADVADGAELIDDLDPGRVPEPV